MKVVLVKSNNNAWFPDCVPPVLVSGIEYPHNRSIKIEKYLFNASIGNLIKAEQFSKKKIISMPDRVVRTVDMPGRYFYYDSESRVLYTYIVKTIKPGRPWTIKRINMQESIYYYKKTDSFKIVDDETLYSIDID